MKTRYAPAALLAILVLSNWSSCGSFTGNSSDSDASNVTYFPNGIVSGSVPRDATNYAAGNTVTVKGNTGNLVKPGYVFSGWNTKADGTGTNQVMYADC